MIIKKQIYMRSLQRERELTIYVPDDYLTSGKCYPVLYINDGQNAFFDGNSYVGVSWGFLDYVSETQLDIIMVAIPCNFEPGKREDEYGPWLTDRTITLYELGRMEPGIGGEGEKYVDFLCHELKPYMDMMYPTDPKDTAIVGSSAGGNIAAYAALRYPKIFSKCAALSSAVWYYPDQFEEMIRQADLSAIQCFYMDLGSNEGCGNEFLTNLYTFFNDSFYQEMSKKGLGEKLHYHVYEGAIHSEAEWRKRVPVFMNLFYES